MKIFLYFAKYMHIQYHQTALTQLHASWSILIDLSLNWMKVGETRSAVGRDCFMILDIFQTRPAGTQLFSSADLPVCGLSSCNDGDLLDRCVITVNEGRTIQHGLFLEMPWRRWVRILFFTTFSVNFEYIKRAMQTLSTVLLYTEDVNHSRFTKSYFN